MGSKGGVPLEENTGLHFPPQLMLCSHLPRPVGGKGCHMMTWEIMGLRKL